MDCLNIDELERLWMQVDNACDETFAFEAVEALEETLLPAVPELIAEIRRLRAENKKLRTQCNYDEAMQNLYSTFDGGAE